MFAHNARIADISNFPVSKNIAAALVEVDPGRIREIHWHPNADEWQYYISGKARMTVFAAEGRARTFDFQAGDVGYAPVSMPHFVENTGDEPLRFLELFRADRFVDISLAQWMALKPHELVQAHLDHLPPQMIDAMRKDKQRWCDAGAWPRHHVSARSSRCCKPSISPLGAAAIGSMIR